MNKYNQSARPDENTFQSNLNRTRRFYFFLVLIFGLGLILFAYSYTRTEGEQIRNNKYVELGSIAKLKIDQISQWRNERILDVIYNSTDPFFLSIVEQHHLSQNTMEMQMRLTTRLKAIASLKQFSNIYITDMDGNAVLSSSDEMQSLGLEGKALALQTIASKVPESGEIIRNAQTGEVFLDFAAPLFDEDNHVFASMVFRTNPESFLYPLLQTWPMPSPSAETLLVRRNGDTVLYLNTLRHITYQPLTLNIPLSQTKIPAVQAVLGKTGIFEGKDYLGSQVLSYILPVPNTAWYMVAKVNTTEALSELSYHSTIGIFMTALVILLSISLAAINFSSRQKSIYQQLFLVEREHRKSQEEIRATLYGIGDGVIATDAQGLVTRLNPVAEKLTGWKEAEAVGLPLKQVFEIINEETHLEAPNPVERVLSEGNIVGLANHTLLIARDGRQTPIADSAAPIRTEEETLSGVVLVFRDQEQERAAQRALISSEHKFLTVFESSPDAILLTTKEDGYIRDANESAELITGYNREELLGQTTSGLGLWVSEKDRLTYTQLIMDGIRVYNFETIFRSKTGEILTTLISGEIIQLEDGDFFLNVIRDISELKQAQEEAREQGSLVRALIDNAPFEVWARDPAGKCILENQMLVNNHGSILGKTLQQLPIPKEELELWEKINRDAYQNTSIQNEIIQLIHGEERYFQSIVAPILDRQEVLGLVGFNIDITERKAVEKALAMEKEELTRSNAELEQFAYVASHDLQEPLRMVSSYMQLIEKRYKNKLDADGEEFIGYAVDGAVRMQKLINDLLLFSRVGTRGKPLTRVSTQEAFDLALRNLQMSITDQHAQVTSDPLPEIFGDGSQLVQLFQNLIANAIKFHGDRSPIVHLSVEKKPDEYHFTLRDNGIGIDPKYFDRIFVIFQRLHERSAYPGTGIGLAICKKIVQRHGGRIWVESQPGDGTCFHFTFPITNSEL